MKSLFHLKNKIYSQSKNEKGSLTVEAAISLTVFMCAILSIAFLMRVMYVHNAVQLSLNQAANELSSYSYLYHKVNLDKYNKKLIKISEESGARSVGRGNEVLDIFDSLNLKKKDIENTYEDVKNGEFESVTNSGSEIITGVQGDIDETSQLLKQVMQRPSNEFKSIGGLLLNGSYKNAKAQLVGVFARYFIGKNINKNGKVNKRVFGISGPGAYIPYAQYKDPLSSLDFSQSHIFDNEEDLIYLTVTYKMKISLPINVIPEIHFKQTAVVQGWGRGDARVEDSNAEKNGSYWGIKDNFKRGRIIISNTVQLIESGDDTKLKELKGKKYKIHSMDITSDSYQKKNAIKNAVNGYINDVEEMDKDEKKEGEKKNIVEKALLIIIPEGAINEAVILELNNSLQYGKDRGVNLVWIEKYGKVP